MAGYQQRHSERDDDEQARGTGIAPGKRTLTQGIQRLRAATPEVAAAAPEVAPAVPEVARGEDPFAMHLIGGPGSGPGDAGDREAAGRE